MVFRAKSDDFKHEIRLKPHFTAILLALFKHHPEPVTYKDLMAILRSNRLACPDDTRLHRKISELRAFLEKTHPQLGQLIHNIRGIGYSLPLRLKDSEKCETTLSQKIKDEKLQHFASTLQEYATQSLELSRKCNIIKLTQGSSLTGSPYIKN